MPLPFSRSRYTVINDQTHNDAHTDDTVQHDVKKQHEDEDENENENAEEIQHQHEHDMTHEKEPIMEYSIHESEQQSDRDDMQSNTTLDQLDVDVDQHTSHNETDMHELQETTTTTIQVQVATAENANPSSPRPPPPPLPSHPFLGLLLVAASAFLFSIMSLLVSLASHSIPSVQITWIRACIQFILAFVTLHIMHIPCWGETNLKPWLWARGTVGMASFTCFYYAISHMSLADATVLFFTAPIFTGIMARVLLNERWDWLDALAALTSIAGVILVARPSFLFSQLQTSIPVNTWDHTVAVGVALLGAWLSACVFVLIRRIGSGTHPMILVQYLGLSGMLWVPLLFLAQTPVSFTSISIITWLELFGIGIVAFIGQCLFNAGVQREKAGPASMMRNLDVVCAFGWQVTVLGDLPSIWSFAGAILITGCCIVVGLRKWKRERDAERQRQHAQEMMEIEMEQSQQQHHVEMQHVDHHVSDNDSETQLAQVRVTA